MVIERKWKKWVYFYVPMAFFIVFTLFPFYWMTAFRPDRSSTAPGAERRAALDARPTLEHVKACCRPPRSRRGSGTRC